MILGVKWNDIKPQFGAQPLHKVLGDTTAILDKSGVVVAHDADADMNRLHQIYFSGYTVHDTQTYFKYQRYATGRQMKTALSVLAAVVLERSIQTEEHSSVEGAIATMDLFVLHQAKFQAQKDIATTYLYLLRTTETLSTITTTTTNLSSEATSRGTTAASPATSDDEAIISAVYGRKFANRARLSHFPTFPLLPRTAPSKGRRLRTTRRNHGD